MYITVLCGAGFGQRRAGEAEESARRIREGERQKEDGDDRQKWWGEQQRRDETRRTCRKAWTSVKEERRSIAWRGVRRDARTPPYIGAAGWNNHVKPAVKACKKSFENCRRVLCTVYDFAYISSFRKWHDCNECTKKYITTQKIN